MTDDDEGCNWCGCCEHISYRYFVACLCAMGMGAMFGMKINLYIAILVMVNQTSLTFISGHLREDNTYRSKLTVDILKFCDYDISPLEHDADEDGPFHWPSSVHALIFSSYYWGYIVTPIFGSFIVQILSAKWVIVFCGLVNIICCVSMPFAVNYNIGMIMLLRVIQGAGCGIIPPAMHSLVVYWSPPHESRILGMIRYSGHLLGAVVYMSLSGIIANKLSWEYVFYITGSISLIWLIMWIGFVADSPNKHIYISDAEKDLINSALSYQTRIAKIGVSNVPWCSILQSIPFWAILIAQTCNNWGFNLLLMELPFYFKTALNMDILTNSVVGSMLLAFMWAFGICLNVVMDCFYTRMYITKTRKRKVSTFIASFIPMVTFLLLSLYACDKISTLILLGIGIMTMGGIYPGYLQNYRDLTISLAGTVLAINATVSTIPGIIVPFFMKHMIEGGVSIQEWRIVFFSMAFFYFIECVAYSMFASSEPENWEIDNI